MRQPGTARFRPFDYAQGKKRALQPQRSTVIEMANRFFSGRDD